MAREEPYDAYIRPMLTDHYQITMAYSYWKNGSHMDPSVFEAFFRKCPFKGEFAVFAGVDEVQRFLKEFRFRVEEVDFLRTALPQGCDEGFFQWLSSIDASSLQVYALPAGTLCFPKIPVIRIEGPLAVAQLCETTILNLINFASLAATNATRFVHAAGESKTMVEFGLRRAQGPDGAMTASKYCYLGGFHATSNVLAGMKHGIPVSGTHAHAYVSSYISEEDLKLRTLGDFDLMTLSKQYRDDMGVQGNDGELVAFVSYALAFPTHFLALVDTYDTLNSGIPNFLCVALALYKAGFQAVGIRLDSGDLSFISRKARELFKSAALRYDLPFLASLTIVASNEINERVLLSLKEQGHEIDMFGVGTHLVTCQSQPALGMVYKLVEIRGHPRIKLSDEKEKVTLPGKKLPYRLYGAGNIPLLDLLVPDNEQVPQPGERLLVRHPFEETKRAYVTPVRVECLSVLIWDHGTVLPLSTLEEGRSRVKQQMASMRQDYTRFLNPTPYKVSVTDALFRYLAELWMEELPIRELR